MNFRTTLDNTGSTAYVEPNRGVVAAREREGDKPAHEILAVKGLYKVFGEKPGKAMDLMRNGLGRKEIFERTGHMIAVDDVSLSVRSGEIFVIMGLSGSGKSTLVRLFNRLIEPTAGQVILEGRDIAPLGASDLRQVRREKMSMVFQSFALLPNRTVLENVAYGMEVAGLAKSQRVEIARTTLARVGLDQCERMLPHELSGGMQQRVGLARALAVNPAVLLMDEAFSALDPLIRCEMQNELLRLQKQERRTIVFISHDIEEALKIGNRIGVMKDGRLIQVGTPADLIQSPADDYVREFFRNVDVSRFFTAADLLEPVHAGVFRCDNAEPAERYLTRLVDAGIDYGYVCDQGGRYRGAVSIKSLRDCGVGRLDAAFLRNVTPATLSTPLDELAAMALGNEHAIPVISAGGTLAGVVSCRSILKQVMQGRTV